MIEIQQSSHLLQSLLDEHKVLKKGANSASNTTPKELNLVQEEIKSSSLNSLLDNLFKDISSKEITKEDIVKLLSNSILKNSAKSIASDLKDLLEMIKRDKNIPNLKSLSKEVLLKAENLTDSKTLKSALLKSGIFLESKLANFDKDESVLKPEIRETIKAVKNSLSDKKELLIKIDETIKNSKISNTILKELTEVYENNPKLKKTVDFIKNILKNSEFDGIDFDKNIKTAISNFKLQLKSDLSVEVAIDKIVSAKKADSEFINSIKELSSFGQNDLKEIKSIIKLENISQKIFTLESSLPKDNKLVASLDTSTLAKDTISVIKEIDGIKELPKEIKNELSLVINSLEKVPNIPIKELPNLELSQKIQRVVNLLKQEVDLIDKSSYDTLKFTNKLATLLEEAISDRDIKPNQQLQIPKNLKVELANDIKATLFQAKDELLNFDKSLHVKDYTNSIDKVINKIEYFQLLSYATDSNISYLPLDWDGLEEGKISIKRLKQKRYFCQIDLKLKDFGKIDIMVMLYNDIEINLSFFSESKDFLDLVKKNQSILKRGINSLGLIASNIYLYNTLREKEKRDDILSFIENNQMGKGIDLQI